MVTIPFCAEFFTIVDGFILWGYYSKRRERFQEVLSKYSEHSVQQMVRRHVFADLLHPVGQVSIKCIVMGANIRAVFIRWKGNHAIPPLRIP